MQTHAQILPPTFASLVRVARIRSCLELVEPSAATVAAMEGFLARGAQVEALTVYRLADPKSEAGLVIRLCNALRNTGARFYLNLSIKC